MAFKRSARKRYLFISHSSTDRWVAKQMVKLIEERNKGYVEVFLDEKDIEGGQSIPDSIRNSIEQCDEFLVLLSNRSKDRKWVLIEMGAAWGLRKRIVMIIDKVSPNEMPDLFSPYKAIDLNDF